MTPESALLTYVLRLGDNALITGQRMIERVTGEPELEEELANANFALDFIGQARMFYAYGGELEGKGRGEDDFAFLRDSQEFENFLMLEQPNGHFGDAIVRQVLFDSFYLLQLEGLATCSDAKLAAIATRAAKEIRYHLKHSCKWLLRLGDGTVESRRRVGESLEVLWAYTGEFFAGDAVDARVHAEFAGPDLEAIEPVWRDTIAAILSQATLPVPESAFVHAGGREGRHSEYLGFLVAEMQSMQRSYPGAKW